MPFFRHFALPLLLSLTTGFVFESLTAAQSREPAQQLYSLHFEDFEWSDPGNLQPLSGAVQLTEEVDTQLAIAKLKSRLAEQPLDYANMTLLGQLLLRHAKQQDDLPAYAASEDALRSALQINPNYQPAKLVLAMTLASRHGFTEARDLATQLNSDAPDRPSTLAVLFDCHVELGDYEQAKSVLTHLQSLENSPPILARAARLCEIEGNRVDAIALIDQAIADVQQSSMAGGKEAAWYQWRKATLLLDSGNSAAAQKILKALLQRDGSDEAALVGLASAHFSSGDLAAAIASLETASAREAPPVIALLGDALALLGDANKAQQLWNHTEELMREEAKIAKVAHAREVAMFYADHNRNLAEALVLSEIDLKQRPDPYAWDAHAWVLFKNGKLDAAKSAIYNALSKVHGDTRILFHAAVIEFNSGDSTAAQSLVSQIQNLNPTFSMTYAAEFQNLQTQLEPKL